MDHPQPRRVQQDITPEQLAKARAARESIAAELPDLAVRDQMRKEAQDEPTLSGEIRKALHSSSLPLAQIAQKAGIGLIALDEFLTGERTLRSDVLDRLAATLGLALTKKN